MRRITVRTPAALGVLFLGLLLAAPPSLAQGCAMCYTASAQQKAEGQRAINYGIFALLSPALLLIGGVVVFVYRRRDVNETDGYESAS